MQARDVGIDQIHRRVARALHPGVGGLGRRLVGRGDQVDAVLALLGQGLGEGGLQLLLTLGAGGCELGGEGFLVRLKTTVQVDQGPEAGGGGDAVGLDAVDDGSAGLTDGRCRHGDVGLPGSVLQQLSLDGGAEHLGGTLGAERVGAGRRAGAAEGGVELVESRCRLVRPGLDRGVVRRLLRRLLRGRRQPLGVAELPGHELDHLGLGDLGSAHRGSGSAPGALRGAAAGKAGHEQHDDGHQSATGRGGATFHGDRMLRPAACGGIGTLPSDDRPPGPS